MLMLVIYLMFMNVEGASDLINKHGIYFLCVSIERIW
jgi:hypothetical protein